MSGLSSGQTPRTSTSSRPSATSFSTPASRYSNAWPDTGESSSTASQRSSTALHGLRDGGIKPDQEEQAVRHLYTSPQQENELINRRQRPRSSGGFLLDPAFPQGVWSGNAGHADKPREEDMKGKRKADDGGIASGKKRLIPSRWHDRTTRATSPLAILVAAAAEDGMNGRGQHAQEGAVLSSNASDGSESKTVDGDVSQGSRLPDAVSSNASYSRPAVGTHLDPAQLVQMALSLSESRRRDVSLGRAGLSPAIVDNRRIVSAAPIPSYSAVRNSLYSSRSLRQASQRRDQDTAIFDSHSSLGRQSAQSRGQSAHARDPHDSSVLPEVEPAFSNATLTRAEKARTHIELFCEYRRLLQFLPPLKPGSADPGKHGVSSADALGGHTDIPHTKSFQDKQHGLGRPYNPLQYLRNRRVRARKKQGLDGDTAGWNNVSKVRSWVDAVEHAAAQPTFRLEHHVLLPKFAEDQAISNRDKHTPEKVRLHSVDRESMMADDWEVNPSDLLADAYWLEQDDNKLLIQDRNGRHAFRKLRSRAHARENGGHGLGRESARRNHGSAHPRRSLSASTAPSVGDSDPDDGRGRRKRDLLRAPLDKAARLAKRKRRHRCRSHSRRSSISYTSDDGSNREGKYRSQELTAQAENVGPFEKRLYEKKKAKALEVNLQDRGDGARNSLRPKASRPEVDSLPNGYAQAKFPSILSDRTDGTLDTDDSDHGRHRSRDRSRDAGERDEGMDSSSSSPSASEYGSRVPSTRDCKQLPAKKGKTSVLTRFRPHRSKERNRIEENDFALVKEKRADSNGPNFEMPDSRGQSFETARDISPQRLRTHKTNGSISSFVSGAGSKSRKDEQTLQPVTSVSRIFKGGRLGDIVRSESSKLTDYIWRKDSIGADSLSLPGSRRGSDTSVNATLSPEPLTMRLTNQVSRMSTETSRRNKLARKTTDTYKPRYSDKLPKFRSISEPQEDSSVSMPEQDHISRQQQAQKDRARPQLFNRLPKIDVRRRASSSSLDLALNLSNTTENSYEWRENGLGRLEPSTSRSTSDVRSSARRLRCALEVPSIGDNRQRKRSTFGLSPSVSPSARSHARPALQGKRHWSISDRARAQEPPQRAAVTKRDIAYVRALLLSSGIKAKEIARRADEPEDPIPSFLRQASEASRTPLKATARSQQYSVAAHMLCTDLDYTLLSFRSSISYFSSCTCATFRQQLTDMRDKCDNDLMPLARQCADDADALVAELNTTHTLGVKQVNDAVDALMRLRRRRLRWLRKIGWVLLEWLLLALMWVVWAAVVLVKMIKGVLMGGVTVVRWILWL